VVPSNSITSIVGSFVGGNGNGFSGDNDVVNESKTKKIRNPDCCALSTNYRRDIKFRKFNTDITDLASQELNIKQCKTLNWITLKGSSNAQ
jgi:hypothetical protein